jgi:hypothetical protein
MKRKKRKKKFEKKKKQFWSLGPKSKLTLTHHNKTQQVQSISASSLSHQKQLKTVNSVAASLEGYYHSNISAIPLFALVSFNCFVDISQTLAEISP